MNRLSGIYYTAGIIFFQRWKKKSARFSAGYQNMMKRDSRGGNSRIRRLLSTLYSC